MACKKEGGGGGGGGGAGGGICVSGSFRVSAFRGHDVGRVWPKRRPRVRRRLQRREGLYLHVFDHLFTLQRGNAELGGGWGGVGLPLLNR